MGKPALLRPPSGAARSGRYVLRKIVLGGLGLIAAGSTVLASGALAGGNGAQQATVGDGGGGNVATSGCHEGTAGNGWAILNAPGQPGNARFINGEVHLVNATPGTYMIMLGESGSGNCPTAAGSVTVKANGIGNGHIYVSPGTVGSYFVALIDSAGDEAYASTDVTIN